MAHVEETPRRGWRRRGALLTLVALAPWLLWLLVAHALLLTPLGERLIAPRSERWRLSWSSGWSLHPGRIHLRDVAYRQGPAGGPGWLFTAERAEGRVLWSRLPRRELHVAGLRATGVEALRRRAEDRGREVRRERAGRAEPPRPRPRREGAAPADPVPGGPGRRSRWRIRLAGVELGDVRRIDGGILALEGQGELAGALDIRVGERALAVLDRARFRGARLALAGDPLAGDLTVDATARLGPYAPRGARGLAALDFLAGELTIGGRSLRRSGGGGGSPLLVLGSPLQGRLEVRDGRLAPGSELRLDLPSAVVSGTDVATGRGVEALEAPRLELRVGPAPASSEPELLVRIEAEALAAGLTAQPGAPAAGAAAPVATLTTGPLRLLARTPERRLSRLLARRPRLGELTADAVVALPRLRGARLGPLVADVAAETVRGRVDLAALLRRELRLAGVEGEGVELALVPAERAGAPVAERPPWTLALDGSRVGVRAVRLGEIAALGEGSLEAALALDPRGDLEVRRFAVRLAGARLIDHGEEAARDIAVDLDASLRRTPLRAGATELLSALDARVGLRGEMERLGFLDHVSRARRWVRLDGSGRLDLAVALAGGRLQPGSRLTVRGGALEAAGLGWVATGRGEVDGEVAGERARLAVRLRGLQARPAGERGAPHLRGQRLDLLLVSRDLDLAAAPGALRAELRLAGGEAPDLARFATLLPAAAGLRLRGGRGAVDAELVADSADDSARGRLRVAGRGVVLAMPELELTGGADLDLALAAEELREGRFRIDGSRLDVRDLLWRETGAEGRVRGAEWWGRVSLRPGTLTWGRPVRLATTATFELRDSAPIVSLLARRRQLPAWVERAVAVRDVTGSARVTLRPDALRVEGLEARGGALELLARMLLAGERRRGHLYVGLGPLGVGAALEGNRRDLRLLRPRAWYQALPPLE